MRPHLLSKILFKSHIHPKESQICAELLLSFGPDGCSSHLHCPESALALAVGLLYLIRVVLTPERHLAQIFSFVVHFNSTLK